MVVAGTDVIGDVHGQVTMLTDLLAALGSTPRVSAFRLEPDSGFTARTR